MNAPNLCVFSSDGVFGRHNVWFWNSLHRLALFGRDRPLLPSEDTFIDPQGKILGTMRMFGREANADTEGDSLLLRRNTFFLALGLFSGIGFGAWYIAGFRTPLRSLGSFRYALPIRGGAPRSAFRQRMG